MSTMADNHYFIFKTELTPLDEDSSTGNITTFNAVGDRLGDAPGKLYERHDTELDAFVAHLVSDHMKHMHDHRGVRYDPNKIEFVSIPDLKFSFKRPHDASVNLGYIGKPLDLSESEQESFLEHIANNYKHMKQMALSPVGSN